MFRNIRLVWLWIKMRLQRFNEYRLGAFAWMINGALGPLISMAIWLAVSQSSNLSLTNTQIIDYFILSIFVSRLTQTWGIDQVGSDITSGKLSNSLVKPYPYLIEDLGRLMGNKLIRLLTLTPVFILVLLIYLSSSRLAFDLQNLFLFFLAILLGLGINFFLQHLIATFAFWLEEAYSLDILHSLAAGAVDGSVIPLALAPPLFAKIIAFSPFRFYLSFPLEIAQNQLTTTQLLTGFVLGTLYLIEFFILHRTMFRKGLKHYGAYGN